MIINLKPLLDGETNIIPFDGSIVLDDDGVFDDVTFTEPAHISGEIVSMAGYMQLRLHAGVLYRTHCARCLKELDRSISLDFEKNVACEGTINDGENDDYLIAVDSELDISEPLEEQLLLEMPYRHLCSEECKGLCPKCGADLNEGPCGCPEKEIDPRLAVLKQLLDD